MIDALTFIAVFSVAGLAVAYPIAVLGDHVTASLRGEPTVAAPAAAPSHSSAPITVTGIRG